MRAAKVGAPALWDLQRCTGFSERREGDIYVPSLLTCGEI